MASLIDLYNGSEYENGIDKNKDKTPISNDGGTNIIADEKYVDQVRGGAVNSATKYSDRVNY